MDDSLFKNPPDFLACAGAYNKPGRGGACAGVLMSALNPTLTDWNYLVYSVFDCPRTSLKERVNAIARLLIIPSDSDQGFAKLKAEYNRIRSLDHPDQMPGLTTLIVNRGQAIESMLTSEAKRIAKDGFVTAPSKKEADPTIKSAIDLQGFIYKPVDIKEQSKEIVEWMDGLLSALSDKRVRFLGSKNFGDEILDQLESLEINNAGQIKEDSPVLMSLLFSIGRAEWMAQTRQIPLQMIFDSSKREAIADGI
jgi:hypothetical protein